MTVLDFFRRLTGHLQGERRGMGSELKPPTQVEEALAAALYPDAFMGPAIFIQTIVHLADVSFWQGVIDFVKMKCAGLAGVFIRAGQNAWTDIKFLINWALAKAARLPRGSYWFYDSRRDPEEQAALWWSLIKNDTGELPHVADFEESYGGPFGKKEHFKTFLTHFQSLSKLPDDRIIIYTGFFWWLERIGGDDPFFKRYRLWLASYGSMNAARIPAPWSAADLVFWQYTASGDGPKYGVSSLEIDLDWYCCTLADFNRQFPLAAGEPPQGEPMPDPTGYIFKITPTESNGSKVRPEPDTGNTPLTIGLPFGRYAYGNERKTIAEDRFEGSVQVNKAGDVWLKVLEVNGTVLPQPGWIAETHLGRRYATITQIGTIPDTDPAPTPEPGQLPDLPVSIVLGDDVTYARQTINIMLKPKA